MIQTSATARLKTGGRLPTESDPIAIPLHRTAMHIATTTTNNRRDGFTTVLTAIDMGRDK